jgi:hypothetical protein
MLDPLGAIAEFGIGYIKAGRLQGWCKLAASCIASMTATFCIDFGSHLIIAVHTGARLPLLDALGSGSVAAGLALIWVWRNSKLTQGLPLGYTGDVQVELNKKLVDAGMVFDKNEKR